MPTNAATILFPLQLVRIFTCLAMTKDEAFINIAIAL